METEHMKEVLTQALDCLNDETPEDCTREEAREDTIQKIRNILNDTVADAGKVRLGAFAPTLAPTADAGKVRLGAFAPTLAPPRSGK
jgi:hypothetical protein